MPRKPFKRYYTGSKFSRDGAGKGSDRREAEVPEEEVEQNWCLAFGHKGLPTDPGICRTCGESLSHTPP